MGLELRKLLGRVFSESTFRQLLPKKIGQKTCNEMCKKHIIPEIVSRHYI